jgi:hypothetical protein
VKIGGEKRVLNVDMPTGSDFPEITYSDAKDALEEAMKNLPAIASAEETGIPHAMAARLAPLAEAGRGYSIYLDELVEEPGPAASPPLPAATAARVEALKAMPLSQVVKGVPLDPPTAVDDDDLLDALMAEKNPPKEFLKALKKLY